MAKAILLVCAVILRLLDHMRGFGRNTLATSVVVSFANAKSTKNFAQQVIRRELTSNARKCALRQS